MYGEYLFQSDMFCRGTTLCLLYDTGIPLILPGRGIDRKGRFQDIAPVIVNWTEAKYIIKKILK